MTFIARDSSGNVYLLPPVADREAAYRLVGKIVFDMGDDFDTGNVDVDLAEITPVQEGTVRELFDE